MMKFAIAIGLLALSAMAPASAATVSFQASLDLHAPGVSFLPTGVLTFGPGFSGLAPAQVAVGDFIHITYMFGGEGISASNVTTAGLLVSQSTLAEAVNQTGILSFLDKNGNAILSTAPYSDGESGGNIGQVVFLSTGPLVFYGLKWDGMLEAATPSTTRFYDTAELQLFGSGFSTAAATPLPASLPLLASALGGLGFAGWRRMKSIA
jgi:hypothetical protein